MTERLIESRVAWLAAPGGAWALPFTAVAWVLLRGLQRRGEAERRSLHQAQVTVSSRLFQLPGGGW